MSGSVGYHAGLSAESMVSDLYRRCGFDVTGERWRGKCGEIDLIAEQDGQLVFIEVKKSKTFTRAAQRLSSKQQARIYRTAEEYLATRADDRLPTCRFDVALVDAVGRVEVLENAIGHH